MSLPKFDRISCYNLAVHFCREILEQSGPKYYRILFQSLLDNAQFAPSFEYFTTEDAYNFFLCYPQVFTIKHHSIVFLNTQSLVDIQPSLDVQNDISNFIYEIREENAKASDILVMSQSSKKVTVKEIHEDIHKKFSSAISEITEIPESIKKDLVYSFLFLSRSFHPLNIKRAFKTVWYVVKNASSDFLDLSKTKKEMFVKALYNVSKAKLSKKNRSYSPCAGFEKDILLCATYLLTKRIEISVYKFTKVWKRIDIHTHILKVEVLRILKASELIEIDKINYMTLGPSFEPVNFIVESYSKLISLCENGNSNQNEQDLLHLNTVGVDCDIQSTDPNEEESSFNCTKVLCEVQVQSIQSNQDAKPKSVEQDLTHPLRVSKADDILETTPCRSKCEASKKSLITNKRFSFDENGEKLLNYSFIIIRRYFKSAVPYHIVLSFLLAFKNVCEILANLPIEDMFSFLNRCFCSINAYDSLPSDSSYYKLNKSSLVEEKVLIICYLVVKSGGIYCAHLTNMLEMTGICENFEFNATYFRDVCKYINFSQKGFLTLRTPFIGIKRCLKNKFSQNYVPSYACPDNFLCFQNQNENKSTEMFHSSFQDFQKQPKASLMFEVDQAAETKECSNKKMFDAKDIIVDISVFILSICEKMPVEHLCSRISCTNLKNVETYSSLKESEIPKFFNRFPQYFRVDSRGLVSLRKGVATTYKPKSGIDFFNLFINCSSAPENKLVHDGKK